MKGKLFKIVFTVVLLGVVGGCLVDGDNAYLDSPALLEQELPNSDEGTAEDLLYISYWDTHVIAASSFRGSIVYLACGWDGLIILNISNPLVPQEISTIHQTGFYFNKFVLSDNILYCYNDNILYLFDVTTISFPSQLRVIFINKAALI